MANPNHYTLSAHSTHIDWYPNGPGGPIVVGQPPANAPTLIYNDGTNDVRVWGDNLKVGPATPAGTFVVALVKTTGIVPGGVTSVGVLIPDMKVDGAPVAVHTFGVVAQHRGVSSIGPGQLETYTELALKGTAENIILPL